MNHTSPFEACSLASKFGYGINSTFQFYVVEYEIILSSRYFYNSIFLFPCRAISHDIAWRRCYCTGVIARALGLHGILATMMCFN